ncbi:MAG: nuclear transport factor 2 family protein [Rhizobiales bacterium]|nr:nuclear transport factor 2 family protein [Hyphomicrobiales bacterium]
MDVLDRFERFYQELGHSSASQLADVYDEKIVFIDPVAEHQGLPSLKVYFQNLMQNCRSCCFDMTIYRHGKSTAFVTWTMRFEHAQLRGGKPISVDGVSQLDIAGDKITRQRDYYDMGAMIYENVPLLGFVVAGLRRRIAA